MIKSIQIKNFKSFEDVKVEFSSNLALLTGVNNSGKSTVLEALSLWGEIFYKNVRRAESKGIAKFNKGDYIFGTYHSSENYFDFNDFNSIRIANKESLFFNYDLKKDIELNVLYKIENEEVQIPFIIKSVSGPTYRVGIKDHKNYDYVKLNEVIKNFPVPFEIIYSAPLFGISPIEEVLVNQKIEFLQKNRRTSEILRNKLYNLKQDLIGFPRFIGTLQRILFNDEHKITFYQSSDRTKDLTLEVKIGIDDKTPQPLENFGSGTIQIIELLTNFFGDSKKLNLLLLDEPDSHIHRDVQKRLINTFIEFGNSNLQVVITSHNEALIRSFPVESIYHLDTNNSIVKPIIETFKSDSGRKKGVLRNPVTSIIKSINESTGIDFINAIEADKIIFVEGTSEANRISWLLQNFLLNPPKNIVFWSLNGVDEAYKNIEHYKTVLSQIKNGKTLWEKCFLILDKDNLTDKLKVEANEYFTTLGVKTLILDSYTFESSILMEMDKFYSILKKYLNLTTHLTDIEALKNIVEKIVLEKKLNNNIVSIVNTVKNKYTKYINNSLTDIVLTNNITEYLKQGLTISEFYKFANKDDIEIIVKEFANKNNIINFDYDFSKLFDNIEENTLNQDYKNIINLLK